MKVNDKIYLNVDCELKLFYYNNDSNFKDHESENVKAGSIFTIVGYVPDLSNNIRYDEESGDFDNYSYVIKDNNKLELYRVSRDLIVKNFIKQELN